MPVRTFKDLNNSEFLTEAKVAIASPLVQHAGYLHVVKLSKHDEDFLTLRGSGLRSMLQATTGVDVGEICIPDLIALLVKKYREEASYT